MQNAGSPNIKEVPARQEVTMNNEYQFVINGVDVNDMSELKNEGICTSYRCKKDKKE